jgi:hypothetical protein
MSQFNGKWACESTDGLDSVLKELNVGMIKRGIATKMKPTLTIEMTSNGFNFQNDKKPDNKQVNFVWGQPMDAEIGGAPGSMIWVQNGAKMVGTFTFKKNPDHKTVTERTIEGGKLIQVLSFKGKTSKRVFKKC